MAKSKSTKSETTDTKEKKLPEVIEGDDRGLDVTEQTREARGITDDKGEIDAGKAGTPPHTTPEMEATATQIEERKEYLRSVGIDPENERNNPGVALRKVEIADTSKKQYRGMVTVSGIHGQTHEVISARIDLPVASGEEYVHYAFFVHHPAADRDVSTITIDPENRDDPNLRSHLE